MPLFLTLLPFLSVGFVHTLLSCNGICCDCHTSERFWFYLTSEFVIWYGLSVFKCPLSLLFFVIEDQFVWSSAIYYINTLYMIYFVDVLNTINYNKITTNINNIDILVQKCNLRVNWFLLLLDCSICLDNDGYISRFRIVLILLLTY